MTIRHMASLQGREVLLAALLLASAVSHAVADDLAVPALTGRVVDQANILGDADESQLAAKSRDLEAKTSIQLVIVTLRSLQGQPIEDWGLTLGRTWGNGQKGTDNGVLLIVAPNDRELRIEVGYGLEGTLPDATADAIVRDVIVPRFRAGNMAVGISEGADAIIAVLTGTGESFDPSRHQGIGQTIQEWAPFFVVGVFVIFLLIGHFARDRDRRGRYYRNRSGGWLYVDDGDGHSGSRFGGSSGGGGFSGGGGSFGGGGASGRW